MKGLNPGGVWAIYRAEMQRTVRTIFQSVAAPVLTTARYFVVFGGAIGSRIREGDGDRFGLVVPFKAVGQRSVIDSALMRLECGYMSITKDREAIGTKLKTLTNRVQTRGRGLVRQSINQVKIYAFHAGPPQFNRRRRRFFEALHPIDGALNDQIETLDAEARAIHATLGQRRYHRLRQGAGIDLDSDFRSRMDQEAAPHKFDQMLESVGRHDRRRTAAEVNMTDLNTVPNLAGYVIDLASERGSICRDRLVAPHHRRVTAAIPAHGPAERNMEIERGVALRRDRF